MSDILVLALMVACVAPTLGFLLICARLKPPPARPARSSPPSAQGTDADAARERPPTP